MEEMLEQHHLLFRNWLIVARAVQAARGDIGFAESYMDGQWDTEDLTALQRAIRSGDGDTLFDLFTRTRAIRRAVIEQGQDDVQADSGQGGACGPRSSRGA